jgi:hypothetical protein
MKAELSEDGVKTVDGMDLRTLENDRKDAYDVDLNNMNEKILEMVLSSYESCMALAMRHGRPKHLGLVAAADSSLDSRRNMDEADVGDIHNSSVGIDTDGLFLHEPLAVILQVYVSYCFV